MGCVCGGGGGGRRERGLRGCGGMRVRVVRQRATGAGWRCIQSTQHTPDSMIDTFLQPHGLQALSYCWVCGLCELHTCPERPLSEGKTSMRNLNQL
jgi:Pyruvate/2-oxoacid:ferredoxin oxidoreductase delta subunit